MKTLQNNKDISDRILPQLFARLALLVLFCTVFALGAIFIPGLLTYEPSDNGVSDHAQEARSDPEFTDETRILKASDGRIGVFLPDGTLESWLELPTDSLTQRDLELLCIGVRVMPEELCELLE